MLTKKALVLYLVVGVSAVVTSAAPITAVLLPSGVPDLLRDPTAYTIEEINAAGGIIIGDKCFDTFVVTTNKSNNAIAPTAGEISIRPIQILNPAAAMGGDYGMIFNGAWSAPAGQLADSTIEFHAYVLEPYASQGYWFKDNSLWMTALGVSNNTDAGAVSVSENLYASHPSSGDPAFVNKFVYYKDDADKVLRDDRDFAPISEMWIIKDVVAYGGTGAVGMAHLSEFYQTFSQTPEPATLGLLSIGGLAVLVRRRKN